MKLSRNLIRPILVIFTLFPGLCIASLQGLPAYERESYRYEYLRVQDGEISRKQAASIVKRRYGGKILSISETRRQGQTVYRVKGLSDKSQVYVVYVDKQSGRISR
ncbi:PepSY domain-containing protein [Microbulbifer epialgicus]|uniref:PepSY domain-containing protein n=1 Tax=Microbulbifer epialgicus TaxID=393907 RepID=A0ABV4NWW9_9GAMM